MRKQLIIILLLTVSFSCEKNESKIDNLKYIEIIPGGCAIDNIKGVEKNITLQTDTVTYSLTGNLLDINVGFNGNCCSVFDTTDFSTIIENDTIFIDIIESEIGICNCICYYNYTFRFTGLGKEYQYVVNINNYKTFTGLIDL